MPGESMLMLCGSGASQCVVRGMVLVQRKQDLLVVCMHERVVKGDVVKDLP